MPLAKETKLVRTVSRALLLCSSILMAGKTNATPVLVVDADSHRVLYQEQAGNPWYPASTTKLMSTYVVFEALQAGQVRLSDPVTMTKRAVSQRFLESGLVLGQTMTLEDALFAMLVASANDVAVAVAEAVAGSEQAFVERMNVAAQQLGMTGSHFTNANGLFDKANYTTARDLALLGLAVDARYPQYRQFFLPSAVTINGKEIKSNNLLLTQFSGTTGLKTGFLCASGRNFVALANRDGKRIMVVTLGATTERERNERTAQFMTQAFGGELTQGPETVETVTNRPEISPEDMRIKLCTDKSVEYEASREALYPMGLPGHSTYLSDNLPGITHNISTWMSDNVENIPLPASRPPEPPQPSR